ncbi:MAG: hypothetical protein MJ219_01140 [Mycoplasmoidaceae bacterium]|nr:hypothetical protein [Mycoplasmoidaceae bacterium]
MNNQINYGFNKGSIYGVDFSDKKGSAEALAKETFDRFINNDQKEYIDPTFTETIFGGSHLVGMLSLGFLIFLIALLVILAALYRTTGVIS